MQKCSEQIVIITIPIACSLCYLNEIVINLILLTLFFQAKSEDQLQIEKDWLAQEAVWLIHKGGFAAAKRLKPEGHISLAEGRTRVQLEHNGDVLEVDEEDIEKVRVRLYVILKL